jgi:hypothetical protein
MLKQLRETVGKEWLPTGTRAVAQVMLLLKKGDKEAIEAFGDWKGERKGSLEGNVTGYMEDKEVWEDLKLIAMAGVVYAGLVESEEVVRRAVEVLCTVSDHKGGGRRGKGRKADDESRFKRMRSAGWIRTPRRRDRFSTRIWRWLTTRVSQTPMSGLINGRRCSEQTGILLREKRSRYPISVRINPALSLQKN